MKSYLLILSPVLATLLICLGATNVQAVENDDDAENEQMVLGDTVDPSDETTETADGLAETEDGDSSLAKPLPKRKYFPRFRWGVSAFGGPALGDMSGGAGGIDARFGAQINNMIGVYGQPILALGAGAKSDEDGVSASAIAVVGVGALIEFDFIDTLFVAIGPELMTGAAGAGEATEDGSSGKASKGPYFSIAARAGVALGSNAPDRRTKFTIALDMHTIFVGYGVAVLPMLSLGIDVF